MTNPEKHWEIRVARMEQCRKEDDDRAWTLYVLAIIAGVVVLPAIFIVLCLVRPPSPGQEYGLPTVAALIVAGMWKAYTAAAARATATGARLQELVCSGAVIARPSDSRNRADPSTAAGAGPPFR